MTGHTMIAPSTPLPLAAPSPGEPSGATERTSSKAFRSALESELASRSPGRPGRGPSQDGGPTGPDRSQGASASRAGGNRRPPALEQPAATAGTATAPTGDPRPTGTRPTGRPPAEPTATDPEAAARPAAAPDASALVAALLATPMPVAAPTGPHVWRGVPTGAEQAAALPSTSTPADATPAGTTQTGATQTGATRTGAILPGAGPVPTAPSLSVPASFVSPFATAASSAAAVATVLPDGQAAAEVPTVPSASTAVPAGDSPATATSLREALAADPFPTAGLRAGGFPAAATTGPTATAVPAAGAPAAGPVAVATASATVPSSASDPSLSAGTPSAGQAAVAGGGTASGSGGAAADADDRPAGQPVPPPVLATAGSVAPTGQPVTPGTVTAVAAAGVVTAAALAADETLLRDPALQTGATTNPLSAVSGTPTPGVEATPLAPDSNAARTAAALPSHVAELARLTRVSADGTSRLVVRLDPPELGAVTLTMTSRGSNVELSMRAETPAGAAALAGQQARVRDLLAGHGFDLGRFTIAASESTSFADAGRGSRDGASADARGAEQRPGDTRGGAGDLPDRRGEQRSTPSGGDGAAPRPGYRPDRLGGTDPIGTGVRTGSAAAAPAEGTWL